MDGLAALTAHAGEIWLADRGGETRRPVYVISDSRVHRLAERAVVAPVLDAMPAAPRPWHVPMSGRVIAVHQFGTITIDRLLEVIDRSDAATLRQVRRAVRELTS